jgi:hypothetical protein
MVAPIEHDLLPTSAAISAHPQALLQRRLEALMTATTGSLPGQSQGDGRADIPAGRPSEQTNLEVRYGKIGISAVAAALRYCGESKDAACVPVASQVDERFEELAA